MSLDCLFCNGLSNTFPELFFLFRIVWSYQTMIFYQTRQTGTKKKNVHNIPDACSGQWWINQISPLRSAQESHAEATSQQHQSLYQSELSCSVPENPKMSSFVLTLTLLGYQTVPYCKFSKKWNVRLFHNTYVWEGATLSACSWGRKWTFMKVLIAFFDGEKYSFRGVLFDANFPLDRKSILSLAMAQKSKLLRVHLLYTPGWKGIPL